MASLSLPYIETPLLHSIYLSDIAGAQVYLKLENTQPSGSFKSRGPGYLVYQTVCGNNPDAPFPAGLSPDNAAPSNYFHFFSPSGGNAGCATAYAARQYGQQCTVCLPKIANPIMIDRIRKTGANVVVHGDNVAESIEYIQNVLIPSCTSVPVYCHPYNDKIVWDGNSTLVDELVNQLSPNPKNADKSIGFEGYGSLLSPESSSLSINAPTFSKLVNAPAAILCSVGGGGLYNGIVQGIVRNGWSSTTEVIAVETEGCAALYLSLNSIKNGGPKIDTPKPNTIATTLAAPDVADQSIKYAIGNSTNDTDDRAARYPTTHSTIITDKDAVQACVNIAEQHKMLVEPACGTALAPIYNGTIKQMLPNLKPTDKVIVVLCGGTAISFDILKKYCEEFDIPF